MCLATPLTLILHVGCILLSVLGEVTPSVDWSDVTSTELD